MADQKRGPWSQREDATLMNLVQSQGPLNWVKISQSLESRTPKQCRERYHQNLKPGLNHEPITPEEGALIEEMVATTGKRWAEIARRLTNRSDNAVKNWWNGSMNRRKRMQRRRMGQEYSENNDDAQYSRTPARLHVPAYHSSPYSSYPAMSPASSSAYPALSPTSSSGSYAHPWNNRHSGLPSPSVTSPGFDSRMETAPSLVSDAGSYYSTSPTTTGYPDSPTDVELPPLRHGEHDYYPPGGSRAEHGRSNQTHLPPLRDVVEGKQLLTAPSSPLAYSPTWTQQRFPRETPPFSPMTQLPLPLPPAPASGSAEIGEMTRGQDTIMKLDHILS